MGYFPVYFEGYGIYSTPLYKPHVYVIRTGDLLVMRNASPLHRAQILAWTLFHSSRPKSSLAYNVHYAELYFTQAGRRVHLHIMFTMHKKLTKESHTTYWKNEELQIRYGCAYEVKGLLSPVVAYSLNEVPSDVRASWKHRSVHFHVGHMQTTKLKGLHIHAVRSAHLCFAYYEV